MVVFLRGLRLAPGWLGYMGDEMLPNYIGWAVLSDEQMRKIWPFSLLNDEQMSNWLGVEHQPVGVIS